MHVHIDGDVLVYRCAAACQKNEYYLRWHDAEYDEDHNVFFKYHKDMMAYVKEKEIKDYDIYKDTVVEPVENAFYNVRSMIKSIIKATEADTYDVYVSGPTNFRDQVATIQEYKGNRKDIPKPVHHDAVKEYILNHCDPIESDGEEADDVMAYTHYAMWEEDEYGSCIATIDKDLDMVPGLHYNFVTDTSYFVTPEQGLRWFYTQLLMGDSTDNIPGLTGVGPVTAKKELADCDDEADMFKKALALYVQGYGEENALDALIENGILLWMRRKEGEIWQPPTT